MLELAAASDAHVQRVNALYAALSHCSQAIVRSASEDELFSRICQYAVQFGGMTMAWIGLVDAANKRVVPVDIVR